MSKENFSVDVIIPAYNDPLRLEWTLEGLAHQSVQDFGLIIINDGGDSSIEPVVLDYKKSKLKQLELLALEPPASEYRVGQARNFGATQSEADILLFLDQDCVPHRETVERHLNCYKKHGLEVVGCGRRWNLPEEQVKPLAEVEKFSYSSLKHKSTDDQELDIDETMRAVFLGCHFSIPRQMFLDIGGFDERFKGWGYEDSDLLVRLSQQGVERINLGLATGVVHLGHPVRKTKQADKNLALLRRAVADGPVRNGGPLKPARKKKRPVSAESGGGASATPGDSARNPAPATDAPPVPANAGRQSDKKADE